LYDKTGKLKNQVTSGNGSYMYYGFDEKSNTVSINLQRMVLLIEQFTVLV
jgi:hypothetical protein